ncbi:hypothetical protein [Streptomyces sp. NPDC002825]|uniref:hypothetical protein n=1 Tax=Streptomyces sp. NPDC002825 TaxID=3154666 RepID=UPI00332792BE
MSESIGIILRAVHDGERALGEALLAVAERHRDDHEIHHVARDVARWSHEHAVRLADVGRDYALDLPGPPAREKREESGAVLGPQPGLVLLTDLRDLHLAACENSLYWEMLSQGARAAKDSRLLEVTTFCHQRTRRQIRWTGSVITTLSPQLLTTS